VEILGRQISADYGASAAPLVLIGILKGSLFFLADLARALSIPVEIELMTISSYGAATCSSGVVRFLKDLDSSIAGRRVLIVEDIIDTGITLNHLLHHLQAKNPHSLEVCTLLNKPARRSVEVPIAYSGFEVADEFVVGYGLDCNQRYRNLPFIGVLKPECYSAGD
jgi:hypoxanthine phosphoribosyltransferase